MLPDVDHASNTHSKESGAAIADSAVVFFDGVCGLCNWFVNFLLNLDRRGRLKFAPLQGETAQQLLSRQDVESLDTVVFLLNGRPYRESSAIVRISWKLGPFWKVLGAVLWIVPKPLRDVGYRLLARSRYRLFGKHETCRLPTPEERERFLP